MANTTALCQQFKQDILRGYHEFGTTVRVQGPPKYVKPKPYDGRVTCRYCARNQVMNRDGGCVSCGAALPYDK